MLNLKYLFLRFKCSAPLAPCYNHLLRVNKRHLFIYFFKILCRHHNVVDGFLFCVTLDTFHRLVMKKRSIFLMVRDIFFFVFEGVPGIKP